MMDDPPLSPSQYMHIADKVAHLTAQEGFKIVSVDTGLEMTKMESSPFLSYPPAGALGAFFLDQLKKWCSNLRSGESRRRKIKMSSLVTFGP
jgi:hypothetical protein